MSSRSWRANGMPGRSVERTASRANALVARLHMPVLLLAGLVVAHDGIFASDAGFAALAGALARSGHGDTWALVSVLGLAGGWLVAVGAVAHILRLRREIEVLHRSWELPAAPVRQPPGAYRAEVRHLWPRLFAFITIGFLLQENLEAVLEGGHAAGLEPLFGAHPLAVPILLALTLAMSAMGALAQRKTRALEERVSELRARVARHAEARPPQPSPGALHARDSIRLRPEAGRAPPLHAAVVSA